MKKALVMEGGAMRGLFTCGVIDYWMENGITFDAAVGVSAGAAFGCNIKSKQIGRALRYNTRFCGDKRYASFGSWLKTGNLYNAKFCYERIPFEFDIWDEKAYQENPMEFYVVASDIEKGEAVYHRCDKGDKEDIEWIRASASIPVASRPVEINGGLYLDGGMTDSIPYKFMEDKGFDKIVVIETQPYDYVKKPQSAMPLIRFALRKYPNMVKVMAERHIMYNQQKEYIKQREKEGKVLVIRPDIPLNIGGVEKDPAELQRVYQLGRKKAEETFDQVKNWL